MRPLNDERLADLLRPHEPPCVSIYLPTNRTYPDCQQNAILYRNLIKDAEQSLRQQFPGSKVRALLEPFHRLEDDAFLWTHRLDGMAVFGCTGFFEVFDLQRRVPPRCVVADSFHVKPLLRLARTADRYQVLCLTRERIQLLEGDRDALDEIDLKGVPSRVEEALGSEVRVQRKEQVAGGKSPGERYPAPSQPGGRLAGHPAKGDDSQLDAERFFQVIDRAVLEKHSRPSGLPLILAALPENQAIFRRVSHNPFLLSEGIERDPEALSPAQLRQAAWEVAAPRHREQMERTIADFEVARARGQGSDDLTEVARSAALGRVGTLLLDADRHLPGRLDPAGGAPRSAQGDRPDVDDVLDDLGELVLRQSGAVLVLPSERMPTTTGLAAIYRY